MSKKNPEVSSKDDIVQAIIIADTYGDEFYPITNDIPLMLLPVLNKPLIDYTLEFLSLGGVEEVFLFCSAHADAIDAHIKKSVKEAVGWSLTLKVHIIVSETSGSYGDCLRDLDQKALLNGTFVLVDPGTISNIKLLPLIKKHKEIANHDKGAAMTLILQEAGIGQIGRNPKEELVIAVNANNRMFFHKKIGCKKERKVEFPLEIFLENSCLSVHHNLKDTHIAICSPSVLPLFSDNFDFDSKDDFVRGLLMNEEILEGTVYCHIVKGSNYGGAVNTWHMYQAISRDLQNKWIYPLRPPLSKNRYLKHSTVVAKSASVSSAILKQTVVGDNVKIGLNVNIENSYIFQGSSIGDNVTVTHSVIGPGCTVKSGSKITTGSILGRGVVIEKDQFVENALVQSAEPENCEDKDKLGVKAFRIRTDSDSDDELGESLARKFSHLHIDECHESDEDARDFTDSEDDQLSYTHSPPPDDTKLFFTEVVDSLTRGFEDKLLCDNLILEINSSRYAYNITIKEVNFNVIKAILHISLDLPAGAQYFSQFSHLLLYFAPILKNYIRNRSAMVDSLQAIEDVAISDENINSKWIVYVLKWFYDKDFVSEDAILEWFEGLDHKTRFHGQVKPFTDWLREAEEATSSEEESE